jgi:hypothetical protein
LPWQLRRNKKGLCAENKKKDRDKDVLTREKVVSESENEG